MNRFYLVPVETVVFPPDDFGQVSTSRGPKYFSWSDDPDPPALVSTPWAMMDYGFVDSALLVAKNISQIDHDALILNADVFSFPDNLDQPVTDPNVDTFFEAINLPTDWLTPATTYRDLMRQTAGIFQFNQRYSGIAANETGETHSIFDNADLSTRLRNMTAQEQVWFLATVDSFGVDSSLVNDNSRLRQLVKTAGDFWAGQTFILGGIEF